MSRLATNFRKLQTVHWRQIRWKIDLKAAQSEGERERPRIIRSISPSKNTSARAPTCPSN